MKPPPPTVDRQRGESLLEVLISMVMIGIAVSGVLAALVAGSVFSADHRANASAEVVLRNFAEAVKSAPYAPGATTYVIAQVNTGAQDYQAAVSEVRCWAGGSADADPASRDFETCTGATDRGLQMVTISAQAIGGDERATVSVLKVNPVKVTTGGGGGGGGAGPCDDD
ncbi:MAG: hypothetical protein JWM62_3223, partial [Frankiales bacterium]|nr:hypothetical protein [Frankiales bacterium]